MGVQYCKVELVLEIIYFLKYLYYNIYKKRILLVIKWVSRYFYKEYLK